MWRISKTNEVQLELDGLWVDLINASQALSLGLTSLDSPLTKPFLPIFKIYLQVCVAQSPMTQTCFFLLCQKTLEWEDG